MSLDIALVKTLGEAPGVMTRLGGEIGKVERRRIVERDRWIDQSVAQIAQRLPERGAAAGALFDAGKGLRAGLARSDDLPQHFFEKKVAAKLQWRAVAFCLES